jgi:hypothetical protein
MTAVGVNPVSCVGSLGAQEARNTVTKMIMEIPEYGRLVLQCGSILFRHNGLPDSIKL